MPGESPALRGSEVGAFGPSGRKFSAVAGLCPRNLPAYNAEGTWNHIQKGVTSFDKEIKEEISAHHVINISYLRKMSRTRVLSCVGTLPC